MLRLFLIAVLLCSTCGFSNFVSPCRQTGTALFANDRRSFLENLGGCALAVAGVQSIAVEDAFASGGATAGGAYLLSVRQIWFVD